MPLPIPGQGSELQHLQPIDFCAASEERFAALARISKGLFDRAQSDQKVGPFDELLIQGGDDEQIWQQLAMRNKPLLRFVETQLKKQFKAEETTDEVKSEVRASARQANADANADMRRLEEMEEGDDRSDEEDEEVRINPRAAANRRRKKRAGSGRPEIFATDFWKDGVQAVDEEELERDMAEFADEGEAGEGDVEIDELANHGGSQARRLAPDNGPGQPARARWTSSHADWSSRKRASAAATAAAPRWATLSGWCSAANRRHARFTSGVGVPGATPSRR